MTSRHPLALAALLVLAAGCDSLIGLGDAPSGAPTTGSTSDGASSGSSGGARASSTVASQASSGGGGAVATTGPGGGDGAGGHGGEGGGGPTAHPCGPCTGCVEDECDPDGRCRQRVVDAGPQQEVGTAAGDVLNRFGRGFVVTDELVAFTRRPPGSSGAVLTIVPRAGIPFDAGALPLAVNGIALSGDGDVIAIAPHHASATSILEADLTRPPIGVTTRLDRPVVGPLAVLLPRGGGRGFLAGQRYSSDLVAIDLAESPPTVCRVASSAANHGASDIVAAQLDGSPSILVAQYDAPTPQLQRFSGSPTCASEPMSTLPLEATASLSPHAVRVHGARVYVLGGQVDGGILVAGATRQTPAFPSAALDVTDDGVLAGAPGGGLMACTLELDECQLIVPPHVAGEVGHVRATPFGAVMVGYRDGQAVVTCLDRRP